MDTYISPLNYSIFVILYITSFVYLYTKYSEIVGLGVLTVIQIAFTLFFGKELSQIIINHTHLQNSLMLLQILAKKKVQFAYYSYRKLIDYAFLARCEMTLMITGNVVIPTIPSTMTSK